MRKRCQEVLIKMRYDVTIWRNFRAQTGEYLRSELAGLRTVKHLRSNKSMFVW